MRTLFIFDKTKHQIERDKWFHIYATKLFGYSIFQTAKSVGNNFWCYGFSTVNKNTVLKEHVNCNGLTVVGHGNLTIGRYFHSGAELLIITQNHKYENANAIPYDENIIYEDVEIGDFVWVGSRVTILPGTKIGEGAIIQAGSVVHGEIPPLAIAGGNPAKVFKQRNEEEFYRLKNEGKFC